MDWTQKPRLVEHGLDSFSKTWTGLKSARLVKHGLKTSLRSRRYSRVQGGKLEIPPAQKLSILSSAHRAHGSAHTNVFALENQSERELLIMLLAGLQCHRGSNEQRSHSGIQSVPDFQTTSGLAAMLKESLQSMICWS